MAKTIRFKEGKVRLWEGVGRQTNFPNIAVKFHKSVDCKEIDEIRQAIKSILTLKYGQGTE